MLQTPWAYTISFGGRGLNSHLSAGSGGFAWVFAIKHDALREMLNSSVCVVAQCNQFWVS